MGLLNNSVDSEKSLGNEFWYPDRNSGGIDEGPLVFSDAGGVIPGTTNGANKLTFVTSVADGQPVTATFLGQAVTFHVGKIDAPLALVTDGGAGPAIPLDFAGIVAGQIIHIYSGGRKLQLYNNGVPSYLLVGGGPHIALAGTVGVGRVITARYEDLVDVNDGFLERRDKFRSPTTGTYSKVHTVYLPLRKLFGFFDYNRVVLKGATHKLSLYTNDSARALFRDAAAPNGRIKFYGLNWWIPYVVPNRLLGDQMTQKLVSGAEAAIGFYDWKHIEYPNQLNNGQTTQIQWTIQQDTVKPVRVFIYFQPIDANSEQTVNSMKFAKTYVQTARCIVNSNVHYPKEEYQLEFNPDALNGENISRAYLEFLRAGHHAFSTHSGPAISIEEYRDLYPIITFDLSKQDDSKIYEYVQTNTLQIKLTFGAPGHPTDLKLYACILNERVASLKGSGSKIDLLTQ
jgi:hypothetical protein